MKKVSMAMARTYYKKACGIVSKTLRRESEHVQNIQQTH